MSIWHYITTEDMQLLKDKVTKEMYWKLSHQCRARIPMLKVSYKRLKRQYGN